jgi:hypothetical protein
VTHKPGIVADDRDGGDPKRPQPSRAFHVAFPPEKNAHMTRFTPVQSAALRAGWNELDCHVAALLAMTKGGLSQ